VSAPSYPRGRGGKREGGSHLILLIGNFILKKEKKKGGFLPIPSSLEKTFFLLYLSLKGEGRFVPRDEKKGGTPSFVNRTEEGRRNSNE